jgi:hypothetical protein
MRAVTRSSFSPRKGATLYIISSKYPFQASRIAVRMCDSNGVALTEQVLYRSPHGNAFRLTLLDDLPDLASLTITTDELGDKNYTIGVADIVSMEELVSRWYRPIRVLRMNASAPEEFQNTEVSMN